MKIPTAFAPKSWEVPPGFRVLEESASVVTREFDGEKLDWLVALVQTSDDPGGYMWTRPLNNRFDAGFVPLKSSSHHVERHPVKLNDFVLRHIFENTLCRHFARYIVLNENGNLRCEDETAHQGLLVASNGLASWDSEIIDGGNCHALTFKWNEPMSCFDFMRLPFTEFWLGLQSTVKKVDSQAITARRFASMDSQERQKFAFEEAKVNKEDAKRILSQLVKAQEIWIDLPDDVKVTLQTTDLQNSLYSGDRGRGNTKRIEIPTALQADLEIFWNWFQPLRAEILNQFTIRDWVEFDYPSFDVSVSRPTAHEQLEAALRWREWKADHEKL